MKKDIDALMKEMKINAIYAEGHASRDSTMYYLLNGANIFGYYIKKRGKPAYVIHSSIEREEALKTGLKLININKYNTIKIRNKYKDKIKADALITKTILNDHGIKGRVAFYGNKMCGAGYNYLRQLIKFDKKIKISYEPKESLITLARETKDEKEIERIRKVRNKLIKAFNALLYTVRGMKVKNKVIIKDRGRKLLIGDLKAILRKELYKQNLISSMGMIVSQGRDAGVPHNSGKDREAVRLGSTIVFDIFPQEIGGGYFFDFTRTICFGYAPSKIKEVYYVVSDVQDYIMDKLEVGRRTVNVERSVCRYFEKAGHKTFLSDPKTQIGYCHSLGHGIGLNVHENPTFGILKTNMNRIKPGMVFTVEPGLYYPNQGFGIRLEDVVYISKTGKIINLTSYPRRLVVEL